MRRIGIVAYTLAGLCAAATPVLAQTSGPEITAMRDLSADLANSYLRIWSASDEAALGDVHEVYAPRVNFYGRILDRRSLAAEKRRFMRRWPVRRYSLRPGTTRVDCDPPQRSCVVRTLIDWTAAAPARRQVSRGVSEFKLGIDFVGPQPLIVSEGGRVVGRGRSF